MTCPNCGSPLTANQELCPNCGAAARPVLGPGLKPSPAGAFGIAAGGFAAGLGANVTILFIVLLGGGGCVRARVVFGLLCLIAAAIPVTAFLRIRARTSEWPFWAGFIIATFAPFIPCTFSLLGPSLRATAC